MKKHAAPILAAILLLLPVLYVGSYLALVKPGSYWYYSPGNGVYMHGYRYFGDWSGQGDFPLAAKIAPTIFWPLEQIDRRVRPDAWAFGAG